ncbi:proteoglycan 4-like [Watersipora subatra]|uniref:proteoglycan 4-like n=1 Tax=Watersipora subatra TaxID=2589382 RepID=UPI00355C57EF
MSADVDKTALTKQDSLLSGLPLLGITIAATFLGLVLIMLLALTFLLLLRKTGCLRRRKTKAPPKSSSASSTKTLLKQSNSAPPTEANGKSNGHTPTETTQNMPQVDDQAPLMMTELPSTKDEPNKSLADRYNRNSWTTRNTSFRLAVEEKPRVVQRLRKPNAQIIAELDDELELALTPKEIPKAEEIKPKISHTRSLHKQQAPSAPTHNQKKRLSIEDELLPTTSSSKIFSPTRTSMPLPSTTAVATRSHYTARQSQSSSDSGLRSSISPGSSLATSGASSPNTVIYRPMPPITKVNLPTTHQPGMLKLESEPKLRDISQDYSAASGIYRAVPFKDHENNTQYPIKTYDKPVNITTTQQPAALVTQPPSATPPVVVAVPPPPPAVALSPPLTNTASIIPPASTSPARPTKLKIPPPTLPKPKYVLQRPSVPHSSAGQYNVQKADAQVNQGTPGRIYSISSPTRDLFKKARDSVAASPAFSPEGVSNAKLSLASSPGQSPTIFPMALRTDRETPELNTAKDFAPRTPDGRTYDMEKNAHQNLQTVKHSSPTDKRDFPTFHNSPSNSYNQGPANKQPVPDSMLASVGIRQPYSRHSIATGSVLTPSIPPWERSNSRTTLREQSSPSPTRGFTPKYENHRGANSRSPIYRVASLNEQEPSYPLRSNVPRMRTSISNGMPSGRHDYPLPGHPRKVATIKPSSSIKHNTYQSFGGQIQSVNGRSNPPQGSYRVRPPTVDTIESNKARHSASNNDIVMTTAFL